MIPFEQAESIVRDSIRILDPETVPLSDCPGRILARNVYSDLAMPPFNKSAMDGYACRREDLPGPLKVIGNIPAGGMPERNIGKGECSKIMTGAPVPEGADIVVRVEYTEESDGLMTAVKQESGSNICIQGEDIQEGDLLIEKGALITPQVMGILASAGSAETEVFRKPNAGIIATGEELVEISSVPGPGQIRDSNSFQLYGQVQAAGAIPLSCGKARDAEQDIHERFYTCCKQSDVVLLSGGVSMGDYDLVPDVLEQNNVDIRFRSIAVKPGKPTHFGVKDNTYIFGLPGNPVSTFVIFELLVKPLIYGIAGHVYTAPVIQAAAGADIPSRVASRDSFIPVNLTREAEIFPIEYHGSAHINAYLKANGIVRIQKEVSLIKKGEPLEVRLI